MFVLLFVKQPAPSRPNPCRARCRRQAVAHDRHVVFWSWFHIYRAPTSISPPSHPPPPKAGTQIVCGDYSHYKICSGHIWVIHLMGNDTIRDLIFFPPFFISPFTQTNTKIIQEHILLYSSRPHMELSTTHAHVLNIFTIRICWIVSHRPTYWTEILDLFCSRLLIQC